MNSHNDLNKPNISHLTSVSLSVTYFVLVVMLIFQYSTSMSFIIFGNRRQEYWQSLNRFYEPEVSTIVVVTLSGDTILGGIVIIGSTACSPEGTNRSLTSDMMRLDFPVPSSPQTQTRTSAARERRFISTRTGTTDYWVMQRWGERLINILWAMFASL